MIMLNFINESSSYDATRHAVRFWGYDGPLEISFFVSEDALRHLQPGTSTDKTGLLAAFGNHRDLRFAGEPGGPRARRSAGTSHAGGRSSCALRRG